MMRSMEEGVSAMRYTATRRRLRIYTKALIRGVWAIIRRFFYYLFHTVLMILTAVAIFYTVKLVRINHVVTAIMNMDHNESVPCTTPAHMGFEAYDVVILPSQRLTLYYPHLVKLSGEVQRVAERSTMCPDGSAPLARERHATVYASYKTHPVAPFREKSVFMNASAICLQHMVDYFDGKHECGAVSDRYRRRDEL